MDKKRSVLLQEDMLKTLEEFTDEEAADLLRAIKAYICEEDYQFKTRVAKIQFSSIEGIFDFNKEKYNSICEQRKQAINKRWHKEGQESSIANDAEPPQQEQSPPKKKESPHHADYDWVSPELHDAWATWLDYKQHEQRDTYKSERSLKMAYNKWLKDCEGDYQLAISAVENSIANNYKGIFPPKQNNGTNSRPLTKYELKKIEQQQVAEALARQCADEFAAENEGEGISYAIQL